MAACAIIGVALAGCSSNSGSSSSGSSSTGSTSSAGSAPASSTGGSASSAGGSATAGSGSGSTGSGGASTAASGTPKSGGTLTVGMPADAVGGLDPHKTPNQQASWVDGLLYSNLVSLDAQGNVIPDLATKWQDKDATVFTFDLRDGVKFSDGSPLTSADVKYSLDRVRDPKTGSSDGKRYQGIESVETPSPDQVVVTLKSPNAAFLVTLARASGSIVSEKVGESGADLNTKVVGSGPFTLVSQTPGVSIVLAKNPNYYVSGQPYLDKVVLKPLEDENTRLNALKTGEIDVSNFVPVTAIDTLSKTPGITVTSGRSGQYYSIIMVSNRPPFNDVRVRQAVMNAIDRQAILKAAILGKGSVLDVASIPSWHQFYLGKPVYTAPNIDKAKQLLKDAGVTKLNLTMAIWSGQPFAVTAAQVIQQELAPLGINFTIKQFGDYSSYNQAFFINNEQDFTIQGIGGNIDPSDWLTTHFQCDSPSNETHYCDPAFDKALAAGIATTDPAQRKAAYDTAQQILAESGPYAFLWNMDQPDALRSNVHGYVHRVDLGLKSLVSTWVG
jgi:ABC-type transport system substrate-binding protein